MIKNFNELYKRTDNPLLRDQTLETLLQFQGKYVTDFDLVMQYSQNKKFKANKEDYNGRGELYTILFETWKYGILGLNKQQLAKLKEKESYDGNIYELFDYLSQNDRTNNTYAECQEILRNNPIINKYCWDKYNTGNSDFVHVYSRELKGKQEEYMEIKHRLYLNPEPDDMYNLIGHFTYRALKRGIPFYYKFNDAAIKNKDDEIILYADDENLFDYLKILEQIAKDNPEIIKRTSKPPMMTGHIDNWIGYATDPQNKDSYNNIVARVVEEALKEVRRNYPNYPLRSQMILLGDSIARKMQKYGYDSQNICFNSKIREKTIDER